MTSVAFNDTQTLQIDMNAVPRLLLLDDGKGELENLHDTLGDAGFLVRRLDDYAETLQTLSHEFYPILIIHCSGPNEQALALCRAIRQRSYPGYLYVILLSHLQQPAEILESFEAGADDYVNARISAPELIARLRTARRISNLERALRTALEEKKRMAVTDALTGLYNRHYLVSQLDRDLSRAAKRAGSISLLMLDIDHFKRINDKFGHPVGDQVLKGFTVQLNRSLAGETAWTARYGGEEFVVILRCNLSNARIVAERIRKDIAASPIRTGIGPIVITVSVGISSSEPSRTPVSTSELLIAMADRCMYRSKRAGRNCVSVPGEGEIEEIEDASRLPQP
jgi:two-component system cell cycle response regulator